MGIVVGQNGVILVDNKNSIDAEKAVLAEIAKISPKPVIASIVLHSEHESGIAALPAGLTIIAHENAKRRMELSTERDKIPPAYFPTRTVGKDEMMTIDGIRVRLLQFAPAATAGDLIAYFPDQKVAFVSSVLVMNFPLASTVIHPDLGGSTSGWMENARGLLALDADTYVSNHGAVLTKENLRTKLAFVQDRWNKVKAMVAQGKSLEQVKAAIPGPPDRDRIAYRKAVTLLENRGIIENGRLSTYGKAVEALPVDRPWAELLVNADDELVPYLAVMSSVESLHRMTREERDLAGLVVAGSDHLTAYNLYAEAYERCGYVGEVYGLPRHLFGEDIGQWAERRGVLVKAIEDAALGMASVFRGVGLPLPQKMPIAREHVHRKFGELLARFMPLDLVIDEETADGTEARVSKTSVCGSWGPIAGELRYFADRSGNPRAAIEGTQVPMHLIRKYATRGISEIAFDPRHKGGTLVMQRTLEYFGFELERDVEIIDEFSPDLAPRIRHALAESLARGQVRHPSIKRNRAAVEEIRQTYRRSGGKTPRFGLSDLTKWYEDRLSDVNSMSDLRNARLVLDRDEIVPREVRVAYADLPQTAIIRDREVDIEYDVEDPDGSPFGIARLRLPEKIARTMTESEVPELDRPVRFVVIRGQRGAVRANTLEDLQELLAQPWSPDEVDEPRELSEYDSRDEQRARDLARNQRQGRGSHRDRQRGPRGRGGRPGGSEGGDRRPGKGPRKPGRGGGSRRKFRGR